MKNSFQLSRPSDTSKLVVEGDYPTFIKGVTVYVTPLDLLKFELALVSGKLLPLTSLIDSLTGDALSGKPNRAYFDFGRFQLNQQGELMSWSHDGSNPSHHTLKYTSFNRDLTLILMSSDGNKSTLYSLQNTLIKELSE